MELGSSALFRLEEGLRILNANPNAKLFVSGYSGGMTESHADVMRKAAIELGTKPNRIKAFPLAKDTQEEAKSMASYLKGKRVALVTEASHLKRATIFFKQAGNRHYASPRHVLRIRKKVIGKSTPMPATKVNALFTNG